MNFNDLPNNSNASKKEKVSGEKKKPVATGTKKKRSTADKVTESLFADDLQTTANYIIKDVALPYIRNMLADTAKKTIDAIFYGIGGKTGGTYSTPVSRVNYGSYSTQNSVPVANKNSAYGYNYSDLTFHEAGAAEEVIRALKGTIAQYGIASVADLYDFSNVPSTYTDNKYGWTNVDDARIIRTSDGWLLKMPRIMPI